MRTLVAYVPVLHEGYKTFFEKYVGEKRLALIGPELTEGNRPISKEIRALDAKTMRRAIEALAIFNNVFVLDREGANSLAAEGGEISMPDEEISRQIAAAYFAGLPVEFENIFLRWDKHNALLEKPVVPDEFIARDELHRRLIREAETESQKSSDIWRHVGALIARNGEPLLIAHNSHLPSEHTPYVNGDPRNNFSKGEHIEMSSAIHAEAALISKAARQGIKLEGSDMYVTVFPCPPCAKLISYAGIKNLYCGGGYGVLDGEAILKDADVKIFFVE